jgi:hypothetical protein
MTFFESSKAPASRKRRDNRFADALGAAGDEGAFSLEL